MNTITKNIGIGAAGLAAAVVIYLAGGATAANYGGAILHHLVDVIQGSNTSTVVATNAPAWSIGAQLPQPILRSVATSSYPDATSGLASSTTWYFKVAALDSNNGTTTLSNGLSQTTDASTTQATPEVINLTWPAVAGATGYAVYFSTTTARYDQYFVATSTSGGVGRYAFATSTGSKAGTNTLTEGTAFSMLLNPAGASWINGGNGTATTSVASTTALHVNGAIDAISTATTSACFAATVGQIFYNTANSHLWLCDGSAWQVIK